MVTLHRRPAAPPPSPVVAAPPSPPSAGRGFAEGPRFAPDHERRRAPVRQHRRTGGGWASRIATAALLVVVLAVGDLVTDSRFTPDQAHRPFTHQGVAGDPVSAGPLEVTVRRVRAAAEITDRPGWRHDTDGVWILVLVRAEARTEPSIIGHAEVRDSTGRSWSPTGRVRQPLVGRHRLQPGVPVEAEIVFEVPRDAATDLVLRVAEPKFDRRLAAEAEVPLPVDDALVAEGLRVTEPVEVAQVRVVAGTPVRLEPASGADG